MVFSIFTELCNHYHNLIFNIFIAPKRNFVGYVFLNIFSCTTMNVSYRALISFVNAHLLMLLISKYLFLTLELKQ